MSMDDTLRQMFKELSGGEDADKSSRSRVLKLYQADLTRLAEEHKVTLLYTVTDMGEYTNQCIQGLQGVPESVRHLFGRGVQAVALQQLSEVDPSGAAPAAMTSFSAAVHQLVKKFEAAPLYTVARGPDEALYAWVDIPKSDELTKGDRLVIVGGIGHLVREFLKKK